MASNPNESELMKDGKLASDFFLIEIKEVDSKNGIIYNSRRGKGDLRFAFWEVATSPGFYSLGHLFTEYNDINKNEGRPAPSTITLSPRAGYEYLLKEPADYEMIWDDRGTENPDSIYIWRMIPPDGYKALGCICTKTDSKPNYHNVRCIKETASTSNGMVELLERVDFMSTNKPGETTIAPSWIDRGSKAANDIGLYFPKLSAVTPPPYQVYLVPGTFLAAPSYTSLPQEEPYALILKFSGKDVLGNSSFQGSPYKLSGPRLPSDEELQAVQVIETYELPFFAVRDSKFSNQLRQFQESPVYKLERVVSYNVIDGYSPKHTETKTYTVTTGVSNEENYSNTIGASLGISVEAGGKAGVPLVAEGEVKVTVSVEARYDRSWGGATTKYEETERSYSQTVTGGSFGVLFQVKSTYRLIRKDGTAVNGQVEVNHHEFYATEWTPIEKLTEPNNDASTTDTITFTINVPKGKTIIIEGKLEIHDGQVTNVSTVAKQIANN